MDYTGPGSVGVLCNIMMEVFHIITDLWTAASWAEIEEREREGGRDGGREGWTDGRKGRRREGRREGQTDGQ